MELLNECLSGRVRERVYSKHYRQERERGRKANRYCTSGRQKERRANTGIVLQTDRARAKRYCTSERERQREAEIRGRGTVLQTHREK